MVTDSLINSYVGNYLVSQKIGEGATGLVYEASHPVIGRRVALKVLHRELCANTQRVERFFSEARIVNAIGHENITEVIDLGMTADGRYYLTMQLLEGQSLADRLAIERRLDVRLAVRIASQACDALSAAHARGVIHRDIKPDNIFLAQRGGSHDFVKILDFGIAKLTADVRLTFTGTTLGTPHYMSPEQCAGADSLDARADVYSLGVALFEMLTGTVPFEEPGIDLLFIKHMKAPPPRPRSLRLDIPVELEQAILKCLAKRPDERYGSMEQMRRAIGQAIGTYAFSGSTRTEPEAPTPVTRIAPPVAFEEFVRQVSPGSPAAEKAPDEAPAAGAAAEDEAPQPDQSGEVLGSSPMAESGASDAVAIPQSVAEISASELTEPGVPPEGLAVPVAQAEPDPGPSDSEPTQLSRPLSGESSVPEIEAPIDSAVSVLPTRPASAVFDPDIEDAETTRVSSMLPAARPARGGVWPWSAGAVIVLAVSSVFLMGREATEDSRAAAVIQEVTDSSALQVELPGSDPDPSPTLVDLDQVGEEDEIDAAFEAADSTSSEPSYSRLFVHSEPEGADVFLRGSEDSLGRTPFEYRPAEVGKVQLVFRLAGHYERTYAFEVLGANERQEVKLLLEPLKRKSRRSRASRRDTEEAKAQSQSPQGESQAAKTKSGVPPSKNRSWSIKRKRKLRGLVTDL